MQSSRAQFEKLTTALTSLGFYRSQVDHSVFVKHSDRGMIALVVYVDDIVITGDDGLGIFALKPFVHIGLHSKRSVRVYCRNWQLIG